jgi:ribosomal protein S18 acetylase RimI-like enzyme
MDKLTTTPAPAWISQVKIRHLAQTDLPALEWEGEYSRYRRLYTDIHQSALRGRSVLWVADLLGTGLIGQLFVQLNSSRPELANGNDRAYIYGFRIKPDYRSSGLGTQMLLVAEADLIRRKYRSVTLNVGRDNPRARSLYERLGYHVVAPEAGEWSYHDEQGQLHEVHEPSWRMEKHFDP